LSLRLFGVHGGWLVSSENECSWVRPADNTIP
jgi:hypothetical protein